MPKEPVSIGDASPKKYALVIGVNKTNSSLLSELKYAEQEAQEMASTLQREACGFTLVRPPLTGAEATAETIKEAIVDFIANRTDDDFLLLYFSGHGQMRLGEAKEPMVYLGSANFRECDPDDEESMYVSFKWLRRRLYERTVAGRVLLILDCCYSDEMGRAVRDHYLDGLLHRIGYYFGTSGDNSENRTKGLRQTLSASGYLEAAHETQGHSFTHWLLLALQGKVEEVIEYDGAVSLQGVSRYLEQVMPEQHPGMSGSSGGRSCILAMYPQTAEERQRKEAQSRHMEREQQTRAHLAQHTAFLKNRLLSFVGRAKELTELHQHIAQLLPTGGYITITGQAGQGKSSMIAKLIEHYGSEQVAFHFIPLKPGQDHQVDLLLNLMERLILKYTLFSHFLVVPTRPALRASFPNVLKEIADKEEQEIIFIDGLDQLEPDGNGLRDLSFLPPDVPQGIVFVLGTRPNDALQPLKLLKPHHQYLLRELSREDFTLLLNKRDVVLEATIADQFYTAMQANALYLDLVAKELSQHKNISPEETTAIIRQLANDPDNIFSLTIQRLKQGGIWRDVIKPVLRTLLIAQEPLAMKHLLQITNVRRERRDQLDEDQLADGLDQLGGLILSDEQQRYTLFHLKLREYLLHGHQTLFPEAELQEWHARFAQWCEDDAILWEDITNDYVEQGRRLYARRHYITHLYSAHQWKRLFEVLDAKHYGLAKVQAYPSMREYSLDLDLGKKAAASEHWTVEEGILHLQHLWRYTLLHCSLGSRADQYSDDAFQLMLLLRQEVKALGLAELLTNPKRRVDVFILIAHYFLARSGQEDTGLQYLFRAYDIANEIENKDTRVSALLHLGKIFVQLHQLQKAEQVWSEAEVVIGRIEDANYQAGALGELAGALAQAGHQQKAEQVWSEAEVVIERIENANYQAGALRKLAGALAQAGQWSQAEVVIGRIEDASYQAGALRKLAGALAQAGQWSQAEVVIGRIENANYQADALEELAGALAQAGQWSQAEVVIERIEDASYQAGALRELAGALAQAGQQQKAEQVWSEVEVVIGRIEDASYQAGALRKLAGALAQAGQWSQAEVVIGRIEDASYQAGALRKLAGALAQAGQWSQAEVVIGRIEDANYQAGALGELAGALAQAGQQQKAEQVWSQAEVVIERIEDASYQAGALRELAGALAQAGHQQKAEQVWSEAEVVIGRIKDARNQADALGELAGALAQAGQWSEAEVVIGRIEDANYQADALRALAGALAQAGQWSQAEVVIERIENASYQADALGELAGALVQAGQQQKAEQVWSQVEAVIGRIEDASYQARALRALARALAQAGQWSQAEAVIERIEDASYRADALQALASALAQAGQQQKAEQVWSQAEAVIGRIKDARNQANALRDLAGALVQAGHKQKAEQVWSQAEAVIGRIRGARDQADALRELARALAQAGQWSEAEVVIGRIENANYQADALGALARALAQAGQWSEAEVVIERIRGASYQADALGELARALVQAGQQQKAEQVWSQVEVVIERIEDASYRARALRALARALAQAGQWSQAEAVIGRIEDARDQADALGELAGALAQAGQQQKAEQVWSEAEVVIGRIENANYQARALRALAGALVQAGQWSQAEAVIERIKDASYQADALGALAGALAQAGQWKQQLCLVQRCWLRAKTRDEAVAFLSLAYSFITHYPEIGMAFSDAFLWVDAFLQGS